MTKRIKVTEPIFYVYEHWRPDTDLCCYVGKGVRRRAFNMKQRNSYHRAIQKRLGEKGMCLEVRLVAGNLTEDEAFRLEIERIAFWRGTGIKLANLSTGGEGPAGVVPSEETRRKISAFHKGRLVSDETRKRLSESGKGRHGRENWTAEQKANHSAKISAALRGKSKKKGRVFTEEHRRKLSEARTGLKRSPEQCAAISARMKGHRHSEETKMRIGEKAKMRGFAQIELLRAINTGRAQSPEHRARISAGNKGKKRSPEFCKALGDRCRGRKMSDEQKAKISATKRAQRLLQSESAS